MIHQNSGKMKNNEIKDEFTARGIDKAKELWRVDNLPEDEQKNYQKHIENLHYGASMAWTMKVDAESEIRLDERRRERIKLATNLKNKGFDFVTIGELTGLSKDEIESL